MLLPDLAEDSTAESTLAQVQPTSSATTDNGASGKCPALSEQVSPWQGGTLAHVSVLSSVNWNSTPEFAVQSYGTIDNVETPVSSSSNVQSHSNQWSQPAIGTLEDVSALPEAISSAVVSTHPRSNSQSGHRESMASSVHRQSTANRASQSAGVSADAEAGNPRERKVSEAPKDLIEDFLQVDRKLVRKVSFRQAQRNAREKSGLPRCIQVQLVLLGLLHLTCMGLIAALDIYANGIKAWMGRKVILIMSLPSFASAGVFSILNAFCKRKAFAVLLAFVVIALAVSIGICCLAGIGYTIDSDVHSWKRDENYAARLENHRLKVVCAACEILVSIWQALLILTKLRLYLHFSHSKRSKNLTAIELRSYGEPADQAEASFERL